MNKDNKLIFETYTDQLLVCPGDIILREGDEQAKVSLWNDKILPWLKQNKKMVLGVGVVAALVSAGIFSDHEIAKIYIDEIARALPGVGMLINFLEGG